MSGGVLVRMVFVQVVFVRGGFCPYTVADNANGRKSVLVLDPRCAFAHEYQNCVSVCGLSIHC